MRSRIAIERRVDSGAPSRWGVHAVTGGPLQRAPDNIFLIRYALPDSLRGRRRQRGQHGMAFVIKHYNVMIRYIILPKKTKTAGSSSLTRYLFFIPQRTTYVTYRYNPVSPVFTPLLCNRLYFSYKNKIVTFWHNTRFRRTRAQQRPGADTPSARQSQRAECLIGLRRKPFWILGRTTWAGFLRRNIWIEAGISLFLMLSSSSISIATSISGSSKPCPSTISPAFFPSVVTLVLIIMSAPLTGFCLRSAPHARGQGRRGTP